MLSTVTTVRDLRTALLKYREASETVALVPTMGALHKGHLTLVEAAKKVAKRVVVSIFVNPLQFGPTEDLAAYPRTLDADKKLLADMECDLLYTPTKEEMYPDGCLTKIDPGPIATFLEGIHRPGHFSGVATVVTKLLLQVMPDIALFGEKDYQQLLVIDHVVRDLNIPVHIVGVPTVRETDGLALSSRNVYLEANERKQAAFIPATLQAVADKIRGGSDIEAALKEGAAHLVAAGFKVDYLELADPSTLQPMRIFKPRARLLVAAKIGKTRLIDNRAVDKKQELK